MVTVKLPSITCVGCGADVEVPGKEDSRWSVRTNGRSQVVETHISLLCPDCGVSEVTQYDQSGASLSVYNLVVETVDPPVALSTYEDGRYSNV